MTDVEKGIDAAIAYAESKVVSTNDKHLTAAQEHRAHQELQSLTTEIEQSFARLLHKSNLVTPVLSQKVIRHYGPMTDQLNSWKFL